MEFKRTNEKSVLHQINKDNEKYSTDLQMYLEIPTDVIDIEEFQRLAIERVKLFRILETVTVRNVKGPLFKEQVVEEINKQGLKCFLPIIKGYADQEARKRDYLSHFVLRLAYCRSEEYRRWFLARELEFFRLKFFNIEDKNAIVTFMNKSNLDYAPISDSEKMTLASELTNSSSRNIVIDTCSFYKVHFTKVLDLVRSRKVFVRGGHAYVPYHDLISILVTIFRTKLSHSLSICAANLPSLESDERLAKILKGLHTSYTGSDYGVKREANTVPLSAIDQLSKKSFPVCMRTMYDTFKKTHHLRYTARQQFGLFLKGIGVTLEDSLKFWKEGFTQKPEIDTEKFEKQYSYSIRHNYGKEGKRANYTPHNCMKIITTSVGAGENHGCPFRHCDSVNLRQKLQNFGLSYRDVSDVAELAAKGHYQLSCTRYFEVTHGINNGAGINHPNQYFEESQRLISGDKKEEGKTANGGNKRISSQGRSNGKSLDTTNDWGDDSLNLNMTEIEAEAKAKFESMEVD